MKPLPKLTPVVIVAAYSVAVGITLLSLALPSAIERAVALTGAGDFQRRPPSGGSTFGGGSSRAAFDNPVTGQILNDQPRDVTDGLASGAFVSGVRSYALTLGELATLLRAWRCGDPWPSA